MRQDKGVMLSSRPVSLSEAPIEFGKLKTQYPEQRLVRHIQRLHTMIGGSMSRLFPFLLLLAACSASMVNAPGSLSPNEYAPVNEASRPGLVKYLNEGIGSIRRARRQDAYKRMHAACGGAYRIDAEGPQAEGGYVVVTTDSTGAFAYGGKSQYWYIQFSCVRPDSTGGAAPPTLTTRGP